MGESSTLHSVLVSHLHSTLSPQNRSRDPSHLAGPFDRTPGLFVGHSIARETFATQFIQDITNAVGLSIRHTFSDAPMLTLVEETVKHRETQCAMLLSTTIGEHVCTTLVLVAGQHQYL